MGMTRKRRLRTRIVLSFTALGFAISALFGLSTLYIRRSIESALVNQQLQRDVDAMVSQVRTDPSKQPGTSILQAWMFSPRTAYKMPLAWQNFLSGVHDLKDTGFDGTPLHYKLAVRRDDDLIGFIRYDVSRDELSAEKLKATLILVVLTFSILSFAIGISFTSRVISPVLELASRLRSFSSTNKREPLAPLFADDEVGELATALDNYADRLSALIERDREFNADVSHELRTPLTIIASTAELMAAMPDLPPKIRERLERIRRAATQCTQLTETLLLLSRSERAAPEDGELTVVNDIVTPVVEMNRALLTHKPVTIELIEEARPAVPAPAAVLSVALNNLLGNACKYTQQGSIVVRVTADEVIIEDTGPGLSQQGQAELFTRGVRGSGATGKGAGLGLAIVKRLCDLYGWEVSLTSRPTFGATAILRFERVETLESERPA